MVQGRIQIEDAEIFARNFTGKEGRFNREGQKTFCVFIDDPEMVEQLINPISSLTRQSALRAFKRQAEG